MSLVGVGGQGICVGKRQSRERRENPPAVEAGSGEPETAAQLAALCASVDSPSTPADRITTFHSQQRLNPQSLRNALPTRLTGRACGLHYHPVSQAAGPSSAEPADRMQDGSLNIQLTGWSRNIAWIVCARPGVAKIEGT